MTSLEADFVIKTLTVADKKKLAIRIEHHFPEKRYIPKLTANMFSDRCVNGKQMPEEENDPSWGRCPLLVDDMCSIYDARPFGCRALLSEEHCVNSGSALMPSIVLTINHLFSQFIEHVDQNGFFGNLSDMLTLSPLDKPFDRMAGDLNRLDKARFLLNQKISVLLIPSEHRKPLYPLLKKLMALADLARET